MIGPVLLDNRAICIRDNVCAVKDSLAHDATSVWLAITIIQIVSVAIAIGPVQYWPHRMQRPFAMNRDNANVKQWSLDRNVISVLHPHSVYHKIIRMAVHDASVLAARNIVSRASIHGANYERRAPAI